MMANWFRLAERYVVAIEKTAAETARIADSQDRTMEFLQKSTGTNERLLGLLAERLDDLEVPDLTAITCAIAELASHIAHFKERLPEVLASLSGGDPR